MPNKYIVKLHVYEDNVGYRRRQFDGQNFVITLEQLRINEIPSYEILEQKAKDFVNKLKNKTQFELEIWEYMVYTYEQNYTLVKTIYGKNY